MNKHRSESGQTLVLVIFAIIGLFGFAALAVDGGMIFSERRRAQNAVDAAALAMASAASRPGATATSPYDAALGILAKNGYGVDTDPNENLDKPTDVQIYHPPISGPYLGLGEYYQVIIREKVDKIFAQFIFSGDEKFTVESVARYKGITDLSGGKALFATGFNICPGIIFNGNSTTDITGGGIFSNSNGTDTSGSCASGIATGSSGSVHVTNGDIAMAGSWIQNNGLSISPAVTTNQTHATVVYETPPNCNGLPTRSDNTEPLLPGYYPNGIVIHNGTHTMNPGLYCLNGNFTVNGGKLTGSELTVYMMPNGGGVSLSGGADVNLTTGQSVLDADGNNFTGYLIFMDKNNLNGVDMAGNNGSFFAGTIYAPGPRNPASQEKCNIGGTNTSITMNSAIICNTIGIAGNSSVTIIYNPKQNRQMAISLEQTQ